MEAPYPCPAAGGIERRAPAVSFAFSGLPRPRYPDSQESDCARLSVPSTQAAMARGATGKFNYRPAMKILEIPGFRSPAHKKKRLDLSHRTRLSRTKIQPLAYYPNFFVSSRLETRAGHRNAPPGHGPVVQWIEFQIPVLTIGVRISSGSLPLK